MIPNNRVEFSLVSELCPFKEFEFGIFFINNNYNNNFFFLNLTYDMMTRQRFYY
ncbi:hypothetical protein O3M35_005010 [Rhynocoris fuscipes]|uniref:Uncharacterized protein n=1 Tax=Rhynocoris fuscipes TaxID=488301 RepID=A0AAW1DGP5_9HEMI